MPDFGRFTRWPDPRAFDLIAGYRWAFQHEFLLGQRSWDRSGMSATAAIRSDMLVERLTQHGFAVARSTENSPDVATITLPGLPDDDPNCDAMVEAWGLRTDRIAILGLIGPVEYVGEHKVPVFKVTIFGNTWGPNEAGRIGLQRDVYMVGRLDVCDMRRADPWRGVGCVHSHVRKTLRRASNLALLVDDAIPSWDAHVAKRVREEEQRLAEQRAREEAEPIDDTLSAFQP